jgi:hypothetical protein
VSWDDFRRAEAERRMERAWLAAMVLGAIALALGVRQLVMRPHLDALTLLGLADAALQLALGIGVRRRSRAAAAGLVALTLLGAAFGAREGVPLEAYLVPAVALALYADGLRGAIAWHRLRPGA